MAIATRAHVSQATDKLVRLRKIDEPELVTLLELVDAVGASSSSDREVVATILTLLRQGRVKLKGNFRNEPIDSFED